MLRRSYFEVLLTELERLLDRATFSVPTAKEKLISLACSTVVGDPKDRFASQAVEKARQQFINFIESISPEELQQVAPLPFRRVPRGEELDEIWRRLDKCWNISGATGFWFPLNISEQDIPGRVIAFRLKDFLVGYGAATHADGPWHHTGMGTAKHPTLSDNRV